MPNGNGNGDIQLSVGLDTKDATQQAKQLSTQIDKTLQGNPGDQNSKVASVNTQLKKAQRETNTLLGDLDKLSKSSSPNPEYEKLANNIEKSSAALAKLQPSIDKDSQALTQLRAKMETMATTKIPTEDYKTLEDEAAKLATKLGDLIEKKERFIATGGNTESRTFKTMEYDIQNVKGNLNDVRLEMRDMVKEGTAYTLGIGSSEFEKMSQQASVLSERLTTNQQKAQGFKTEIENAKNKMNEMKTAGTDVISGKDTEEYAKKNMKLQESIDKMKVALIKQREITKETKSTGKEISNNTKKLKDAPASMESVSKATKNVFKNILKWGFGIRSAFILVRKLRSAIKEGFSNLISSQPTSQLAQQIDRLKGSIATLKNAFAAAFAPIVTMALPYIQKVIDAILKAINIVGQFFAALSGQKTYTKAIKQSGSATDGATKSTKNNTKATKDNKKAKDEQLKQLSSIDELNNLSAQSQEDLNDAIEDEPDTGGGGTANMFEEVPVDNKVLEWLDKIKKAIEPIKEAFQKGFLRAIGDWESKVADIKKNAESIKESLVDIFTDPKVKNSGTKWALSFSTLLGAITGTIANMGLVIAQNLVGGIAKFLESNKEDIKQHLINMFDIGTEINEQITSYLEAMNRIFDVFGGENAQNLTANILGIFYEITSNVQEICMKLGRDIITYITQPIIDNKDKIAQALDGLLGTLSEITGSIKQFFDTTFGEVQKLYDEHIKPLIDSLTQGASEVVGVLMDSWNTYVQPLLDEISQIVNELLNKYIQPVVSELIGLIGDIIDILTALFNKYVKPLFIWLSANVLPVLTPILSGVAKIVQGVFGTIFTVIETLLKVLRAVIQFVKEGFTKDWNTAWENLKNKFGDIWNAMKEKMKSPLNAIIAGVEKLANCVISGINALINSLNSVNFSIPSWVPGIGGNSFGFNLSTLGQISLPRLATGGVIPPSASEHLAVLGDNNKETEVVSPLSTMRQAMLEALRDSGLSNGRGSDNADIVIQIDGNEIMRVVRNQDKMYKKATGRSAFA